MGAWVAIMLTAAVVLVTLLRRDVLPTGSLLLLSVLLIFFPPIGLACAGFIRRNDRRENRLRVGTGAHASDAAGSMPGTTR